MGASEFRQKNWGTRRRIPGFAVTLVLGLAMVFPPAGLPSDAMTARAVLVAGGGDETPKVERALDDIANYLLGQGVQVYKPQNWRAPLAELAPIARESGAHSILVLEIKFGYLEYMRADCYLTDGKLLWSENLSSSFGISTTGIRTTLVTRMVTKLKKRVGDSCLPKSS